MTSFQEEISLKMKQQRDLAAEAEKAKKELEAEKVMNENELARLKKLQHKTSENVKGKLVWEHHKGVVFCWTTNHGSQWRLNYILDISNCRTGFSDWWLRDHLWNCS